MDFIITAIAFIVIFSVLILIHECGHFFAARAGGIKVEEFGFGLPPKIWGKKKGETIYSINAIPFGGFVRLLGEDGGKSKAAQSKRSFISKSPRIRIFVVIAGVTMNFLLALLLLTIGFTVGMKPMILDGDDILKSIADGVMETEQGIIVKEVQKDGPAQTGGLTRGDTILSVNGKEVVSSAQMQALIEAKNKEAVTVLIERSGQTMNLNVIPEGKGLGFSVYDLIYLPRVIVEDVKDDSEAFNSGILKGDIILGVNGTPVYTVDDFEEFVSPEKNIDLKLLRGVKEIGTVLSKSRKELVLVSTVYPDTPAEKAGLRKGDVIAALGGEPIFKPEDAVDYTKQHIGQDIVYNIKRDDSSVDLTVRPREDGLIGVGLSQVMAYQNHDLSLYGSDVPTSIINIKDVSYPFWIAPVKAFQESGRLAVLTVGMFVDVVKTIVTKFTVPEGVAGPVGIAVMTHVFVQEGLMSLLRFMALLSLSLAIINIFPLPALDGGKLIFILLEVLIGRKINPKFENVIHALGFVLLMLLILLITFSDISKFFV
jgi:regulator of sigma E protease